MAKETRRGGRKTTWDAGAVRSLRGHLGMTQQELADELNVRQQTVSEWETGQYRPRGASERLLSFVAERAAFQYGVTGQGPGAKGRTWERSDP
ncbi:MAG: helix-turn-helix domain-containing protein [Chloroflexi bacterium]|nr:helix-turn-helix domain-containing protein [Chloroflexota bacterium]